MTLPVPPIGSELTTTCEGAGGGESGIKRSKKRFREMEDERGIIDNQIFGF